MDQYEDQLKEFRQRHHARFIHREKERLAAQEEFHNDFDRLVESISECSSLIELRDTLSVIISLMKEKQDKYIEIDRSFEARGLKIVDEISKNKYIKINLNSSSDVESAALVRDLSRTIVLNCKVEGAQDIEIQFDMDCSRDEQIARELSGLALPRPKRGRRVRNTS